MVCTSAFADERVAIRLAYDGGEGCPPAPAFAAEVTARTARVRMVAPGEAGRELRVRVRSGPAESRGTLEIEGGGSREVKGATCAEVVSALALVSALAFDPQAETGPVAATGGASGNSAPPASTGDTPPPAPAAAAPARAPPPAAPPSPAAPAPRATTETAVDWALGLELALAGRMTPRVLVGGGPFVEVRGDAGPGWAVRAAFTYATTGPFDQHPGGAIFTWAAGRLAGCVPVLRPSTALAFAPCVDVEAGALTGAGLARGQIVEPREATIAWLSSGLVALVRLDIQEVVAAELRGGASFPWVRHLFVFETPDVPVHEVPAVVWTLGAGVGVFP
jgi:hypothetical protein